MIVRKGVKEFVVRALHVFSRILMEWVYQLDRLAHAISTPKVVREAEAELIKASIMEELEQDDPGWDGDWEDDEDRWWDGREWHLRDPDNRDDR